MRRNKIYRKSEQKMPASVQSSLHREPSPPVPSVQLVWHHRSVERSPRNKRYSVNAMNTDGIHKSTQSPYLEKPRMKQPILSSLKQSELTTSAQFRSQASNSLHAMKTIGPPAKLKGTLEHRLLDSARELTKRGQNRKALLLLKSILREDPSNLAALHLSAANSYSLRDFSKAIESLQRITFLDPASRNELLQSKLVTSMYAERTMYVTQMQLSHQHYPEDYECYILESRLRLKLQQSQQAIVALEQAVRIADKDEDVLQLGLLYASCGQPRDACQCYDKLISRNPKYPVYSLNKMRTLRHLGEFQKMLQTPSLVCEGPIRAEMSVLRAYAHYKLKDYTTALTFAEDAEGNLEGSKLTIAVHVLQRNFYEAGRVIGGVAVSEGDTELKEMSAFVEGVINLMRSNIEEGMQCLNGHRSRLLRSASPGRETANEEYLQVIQRLSPMFYAYGHYCLGEFQSCKQMITLQRALSLEASKVLDYNYAMCEGIIKALQLENHPAEQCFQTAELLCEDRRPEPSLCLAILYVQMLFQEPDPPSEQSLLKARAKEMLDKAVAIVTKQSRSSASAFYHRGVYYAYLKDWKEALRCLDEAVERSEDHYWRYYYVRALLLACLHSFREAISQVTIAINLCANRPQCFLLRSKCLQIEGEGNEAFRDLQEYIALKPDEVSIHRYAGQLLFENGAFEDALTAFSHQPIPATLENMDVLMTEAKSYFLLGRFGEASSCMSRVYSICPSRDVLFDISILDFLTQMMQGKWGVAQSIEQLSTAETGRIFKRVDCYTLVAICKFYEGKYSEAKGEFERAVEEKRKEYNESPEAKKEDRDYWKDVEAFTNQFLYNISVCWLLLEDVGASLAVATRITLDQPFSEDVRNYQQLLAGEVDALKKDEVFPNKNKLSSFFKEVHIKAFKVKLRLCVPFPKVEPPEIFPAFDPQLLRNFTVLAVDRKPEAPWIVREENSIKFTERIRVPSRFKLDDSDVDSVVSKKDSFGLERQGQFRRSFQSRVRVAKK